MTGDVPPGSRHNPSAWPRRLPVLVLALAGCAIATYLALYQLQVVGHVWEPFFGDGSRVILRESSIARLLPVPDALLGAAVYLLGAAADLIGGGDRWRTMPWAVLLLGVVSGSLGAGGVVLAVCQPALFGTFCTLCLASAACSVLLAGAVSWEVLATWQHLRRESARGVSWWSALWGQARR
jgi:uncharacterized membrane protein